MITLLRILAARLRTHPVAGRWALRLIPDVIVTRDIRGIGPFRLRLRRNRALWLREPIVFEAFPFSMLEQLVRPGAVVYDCGANIGLYARYLIATLGAGRVVSFEPDEENLELLAKNAAVGGIVDRVTIVPEAVSDQDGQRLFQKDDMSSASGTLDAVTAGAPSVGRSNLGLPPRTVSVPCLRLDTAIGERGLPIPDVIKVDVEGAAGLLLCGARDLLERHGPSLLIELHGPQEVKAVLEPLLRLGYLCAGKVAPHIHKSGYGRVDSSTLSQISGLYDVEFLVAVRHPEGLPRAGSPGVTE